MARWHPASGRTAQIPLNPSLSGFVYSQLTLPSGLLALTTTGSPEGAERWRFVFLPSDGSAALKLETNEVIDPFQTNLLKISDDVVALVTRDTDKRYIKVFTVQRVRGRLELTPMPALPIAYRSDFASAVAGKDQLMILGGSNGDYRGCSPCRAETHVLDLKTRIWRNGPPMLEARSELAASSLPDGSILVTGGWTKAAEWGSGASRTAERWNPATNRFEALPPMPNGTARHRHLWWNAPWGRSLLVVPGIAGAVQSLDTRTWTWRTVGAWAKGSEEGGCGFYPFVVDGNAYAWLLNRTEGFYSGKSCGEQQYAELSLLRPPSGTAPPTQAPPESALVSYRGGAAFVPAAGQEPALMIGGSLHAGMNTYVISSAVEAIDRDGHMTTLPSLRTARTYAKAFRAAGGILVVAGRGPDSPYGGVRNPPALKAEWLPPPSGSTPWQWQEVIRDGPSESAEVAQMRDGSLLALDRFGEPRRFKLYVIDGKPHFESTGLPSLNRERRHGDSDSETMRIQELDDGRIIVAGGKVQPERIALYSELTHDPEQPDMYVGIGEYLPWRRYEIFDPSTQQWTDSVPAKAAGGYATIASSGRVVKIGRLQTQDTGTPQFALEVSNPSGSAWAPLANKGSRLHINSNYRVFTLDGELFASGEVEYLRSGGALDGVEWLNPATNIWELLWQATDGWRKHEGRILRRTLTGANGQPKTLLIPVGGP